MSKKATVITEERDERIQRYELVYLIPNKFSENELDPIKGPVIKLIKDNGGLIVQEETWGKQKLAYPIKGFFHAYYFIIEFDSPRENINKLNNYLRLNEDVLRHLITQKRIKTAEEIANEKRAMQKMAEEQAQALKEKTVKPKAPAEAKEKEVKKVSIEELDEKLNKILDDTESLL
ncbi:MAG: 30S ribosomal protein S6 [Patescibacteria group bacterium]